MRHRHTDEDDTLVLFPETVEEMMVAIGIMEHEPQVKVAMSAELMAHICTRIVALEDTLSIEEDEE